MKEGGRGAHWPRTARAPINGELRISSSSHAQWTLRNTSSKLGSFSCLFWLVGREIEAFRRSLKDLTRNTFESKLRLWRNFQWTTQSWLQLGWRLNPPSLPCSQRGLVAFGAQEQVAVQAPQSPDTELWGQPVFDGSLGVGGWEQWLHQQQRKTD